VRSSVLRAARRSTSSMGATGSGQMNLLVNLDVDDLMISERPSASTVRCSGSQRLFRVERSSRSLPLPSGGAGSHSWLIHSVTGSALFSSLGKGMTKSQSEHDTATAQRKRCRRRACFPSTRLRSGVGRPVWIAAQFWTENDRTTHCTVWHAPPQADPGFAIHRTSIPEIRDPSRRP
jgi:hypothetical protein